MNPDISIQLHTLKNFISGNGITLTTVNSSNLVVYEPCSLWPAGLVIFLSPFYYFTGKAILSAILIKSMSTIFLIYFIVKYLDYLQLENHQKKIILLFFVLTVSPVIHFLPADTLATVLCLWGIYFNMNFQEKKNYFDFVVSIILLALSYFVKYSFLPFIFFPFAAFIIRERKVLFAKWKQTVAIFMTTIIGIVTIYSINYWLVGKQTMVSSFDALHGKPHWTQLERIDGFLFTFGNVYEWAYENFLRDHFGINIQFNWISLFATGCFYFIFIAFLIDRKKSKTNALSISLNTSIIAGLLILLFLSFLSLNNTGNTSFKPYWTFVEETRYYGPVIVIGLINILIVLMLRKNILAYLVIAAMFFINLFAYDFSIHNGFWGITARTYKNIPENMAAALPLNNSPKTALVYFSPGAKKSEEYYYLQSQGVILLEENKYQFYDKKSNQFACYELNLDSNGVYKIILCN